MLATTGPSICTTRVALDPAITITILNMATRKLTEVPIATDSAEVMRRATVSMAAATTGDRIRADPQQSARANGAISRPVRVLVCAIRGRSFVARSNHEFHELNTNCSFA